MFRRVLVSFMMLAAVGLPAAVWASPAGGVVAGVSDRRLATEVADQVRAYAYYTIFDDVQGTVPDGVVTLTGKVTESSWSTGT